MITALVLAAGLSKRMGQQKLFMQWGETTVIGKVVTTILEAEINAITLVCGGNQVELEKALRLFTIDYVNNKLYANGEMLTSIQVGLSHLAGLCEAALVVLGDQPQIESSVVMEIDQRYNMTGKKLIVPSYQLRRGHPMLIEKSYWMEICELVPPATMRDFLSNHASDIDYLCVDTPSVIQDLDTQADYSQYKP